MEGWLVIGVHTYNELKIRFEREEGGAWRVYASGPAGEAVGDFVLPFEPLELENFVLKVGGAGRAVRRTETPQTQLVTDFGSRLFDALFQARIRDLYRDSRAVARSEEKGLRVTLSLAAVPELMHIPWEYLYDAPNFLSISTWTPVVRYLDLPRGRRPLTVTPPLRILAMVSSPTDEVPLDTAHERRNLEQALQGLVVRGAVEITWLEQATLRALQEELQGGPYHIFHYIGHGAYDHRLDDGILVLEDENERGRSVTGVELGTMLYDHTTLRLAILNACEGARSSSDDPFAGVACSLVQREIPAVIAMQFEITDRAAIIFAQGFYGALAHGYPVDSALAEARKAIFADRNALEWATPVLFMRVPDGRIFDLTALPTGTVIEREPQPEPVVGAAPLREPEPESEPRREPEPEPKPRDQEPVGPVHIRRRHRISRIWLAAGAVSTVALVIGIVLLTRGGGDGAPFHWSASTASQAFGGPGHQEMTGIAAVGADRAVAVGYDEGRDRRMPAVWTFDSSAWKRARTVPDGVGGLHSVAIKGETIVAVGRSGPTDLSSPVKPAQDALVWTFADGRWTRVCQKSCGNNVAGGGGLGQTMYAVVARSRGGFVGVGYDVNETDHHFDAAVWTSADGSEWSRVPANQQALGGPRDQVMRAMAETQTGLLVAVGWSRLSGAVWTSRDGRTWTRHNLAPFDPLFESSIVRLTGIVQQGSRLVVVGFETDTEDKKSSAAAWAAADNSGTGWHRIKSPPLVRASSDQQLLGVTSTASGAVAVGYDHSSDGTQIAAVWLLADDATRLTIDTFKDGGDREMNAVAQLSDGSLLAVGDAPSRDEPSLKTEQDAQVWIGTPHR